MNWGIVPDLGAVALLTVAFGSVARRGKSAASRLWLIGWISILLHFLALIFTGLPGTAGVVASAVAWCSLVWGGMLFMWACVPYRKTRSSRGMIGVLVATNTLYMALIVVEAHPGPELAVTAALMGMLPLAVALLGVRNGFYRRLRWVTVGLYAALAVFLLAVENRPGHGADWAFNAVLFTVYLSCCIHFWLFYRRATAGALLTITGFLAWASVFVVGPVLQAVLPGLQVNAEVWNLPKYVVAAGMILLLLEDQIEHNQYLALHDDLTGLPNRRLYQDRLDRALERARRAGTRVALLLIDLDHFKRVNDSEGHHIGDLLLRQVGKMFLSRLRRMDTVARTGGDEFAVVLEEPVSREDAERVSAELVKMLEVPLELDGRKVKIGATVGVAVYPDDASTAETLRVVADLDMYAGKHAARGESPPPAKLPQMPQPSHG